MTPETIVLSLQNGVENEALLASVLRLPPLLGAMTQIGVELMAPGVVRHGAGGTIFFGEITGHESGRTRALADLFRSAGIRHHLRRHAVDALGEARLERRLQRRDDAHPQHRRRGGAPAHDADLVAT